ncbi:22530_t:CDS:1, partial [Gigaspora rosea]
MSSKKGRTQSKQAAQTQQSSFSRNVSYNVSCTCYSSRSVKYSRSVLPQYSERRSQLPLYDQ